MPVAPPAPAVPLVPPLPPLPPLVFTEEVRTSVGTVTAGATITADATSVALAAEAVWPLFAAPELPPVPPAPLAPPAPPICPVEFSAVCAPAAFLPDALVLLEPFLPPGAPPYHLCAPAPQSPLAPPA